MGIFSSLKILLSNKKQNKKPLSLKVDREIVPVTVSFSSSSSRRVSKNNNHSPSVISSEDSPSRSTDFSAKQQITGSGYSFQYKDGRRYHAEPEVSYVLPNDDDEFSRIDQQHWVLRYALQCNFQSPINQKLENGITTLDSGCGPGTWLFEMAETYPYSKFYGVDASCVFPEDESKKPSNLEFAIANVAKEVPYEENYFDFIHQRLLFLGLTDDDWGNTLKEFHRVLKPGGYIELAEPDLQDMPNAGPSMNLLQSTLSEMSMDYGFPPRIATELKQRLLKAGFVNVRVKITEIPLNHSNRVGELLWGDYRHACLNIQLVMAKSNPAWEHVGAYEAHIDKCGEEAKKNKTSLKWYSVYARKPKPRTEKSQELNENIAVVAVE